MTTGRTQLTILLKINRRRRRKKKANSTMKTQSTQMMSGSAPKKRQRRSERNKLHNPKKKKLGKRTTNKCIRTAREKVPKKLLRWLREAKQAN